MILILLLEKNNIRYKLIYHQKIITIKPSNDDMIHVHIDETTKRIGTIEVTFWRNGLSFHKDMLKLRKHHL